MDDLKCTFYFWFYMFGLQSTTMASVAGTQSDDNNESEDIENFEWLENKMHTKFDIDDLISWIVVDIKTTSIVNEKHFCDENILDILVSLNSKLDCLSDRQLDLLKKRINSFESIGRSIFINRNGVKLANIDWMLDNMFTNPIDKQNESLVKSKELFYIAAIGSGSDGFVDYMLWRRGWKAKCFAFSLSRFSKMQHFASKSHSVWTYNGLEKYGGEANSKNIQSYLDQLKRNASNGVHIVVADSAIPVQRDVFTKEIVSKQLHLGCCAFALAALQSNGHFIMKIFDVLTPFTVGLIFIMYKCFDRITIVKPHACRPSNAERYLVCKWKKSNTDDIARHLLEVNETMTNDMEIIELVALDVLKKDESFFQYICNTNNDILLKQILAKEKMLLHLNDRTLTQDIDKVHVAEKYRKLWNLPDQHEFLLPATRSTPMEEYVCEICPLFDQFKHVVEKELLNDNLEDEFRTPRYWYFLPIENVDEKQRTFFVCKSAECVFKYDKDHDTWTEIDNIIIFLPSKTLIYGEIINVLDEKFETNIPFLNIIDCFVLEGEKLYEKSYLERSTITHQFVICAGNNKRRKINGKSVAAIESQMKKSILKICDFMDRFRSQTRKSSDTEKNDVLVEPLSKNRYFIPSGLIFVHDKDQFACRKVWKWTDTKIDTDCLANLDQVSTSKLHFSKLVEFLNAFSDGTRDGHNRQYRSQQNGRGNSGRGRRLPSRTYV